MELDEPNGGRGDCFQLWVDDAKALLDLPEAEQIEALRAILKWFVCGDAPQGINRIVKWFVDQLLQKQTRAAKEWWDEHCRRVSANRANIGKRWNRKPTNTNGIPTDTNGIPINANGTNENENETIIRTETKRNENETPQAASVSPPISDSTVSLAIAEAAQRLGDESPSRDKWERFIQAHGVGVFVGLVEKASAARGVVKRGAYLNRLLDAWQPLQDQPPLTKPKPKTWTREDWRLCEERCANFDTAKCSCGKGAKSPPEHDPQKQHPPEECPKFKPHGEIGALDGKGKDFNTRLDTLSRSLAEDYQSQPLGRRERAKC